MPTKLKLSPAQQKVVDKMREGYQLVKRRVWGGYRWGFYDKDDVAISWAGENSPTSGTAHALISRKIIEVARKDSPNTLFGERTFYTLNEDILNG